VSAFSPLLYQSSWSFIFQILKLAFGWAMFGASRPLLTPEGDRTMRKFTIAALAATSLLTAASASFAGNVNLPSPPKPLPPSPSLADKVIKGTTYTTKGGTTIAPTIVTPQNLNDPRHPVAGPGVKITF
jgi:hypothetical protein